MQRRCAVSFFVAALAVSGLPVTSAALQAPAAPHATSAPPQAATSASPQAAPAPQAPVVVGMRSPALTATVTSVADAPMSTDAAGKPLPVVAAGSGMATVGAWTFVVQDNSTMLALLGENGNSDVVRLFPPIEGADRFLKVLGNRKAKPDIEALVLLPTAKSIAGKIGVNKDDAKLGALLALASGSTSETHERVALVFPNDVAARCRVVPILAKGLYARMRAEPLVTGGSGELTLEGGATVDGGKTVRIFNRNKKGGRSTSVDIAASDLLGYLVKAKSDPLAPFKAKLTNPRSYDLGLSDKGTTISIGDATTIPDGLSGAPSGYDRNLLLFSASAEEHDDTVGGAMVGLCLPDGTVMVAPLTGLATASGLKVEGLAVRSAVWSGEAGAPRLLTVKLRGVVDPDASDPAVPSPLVEVDVVFTPPASATAPPAKHH